MPINSLLRDSKLDPSVIQLLDAAFNKALRALHLVDRDDPVCDLVARNIVEIYESGVLDPSEIAEATVKKLGP
jgi:hypothetical protein